MKVIEYILLFWPFKQWHLPKHAWVKWWCKRHACMVSEGEGEHHSVPFQGHHPLIHICYKETKEEENQELRSHKSKGICRGVLSWSPLKSLRRRIGWYPFGITLYPICGTHWIFATWKAKLCSIDSKSKYTEWLKVVAACASSRKEHNMSLVNLLVSSSCLPYNIGLTISLSLLSHNISINGNVGCELW